MVVASLTPVEASFIRFVSISGKKKGNTRVCERLPHMLPSSIINNINCCVSVCRLVEFVAAERIIQVQ